MPFEIIRNDITKMKVDAIVNAANSTLLGGGGVDGAIHRAAGPSLLEECRKLNGCPTGEARITGAGNLDAKYVIHTVGPVWYGGEKNEPELLASAYKNSLKLAKEAGCESVAFPLISSGAYGYPIDQALKVATDTITEFLAENEMMVYLVIFNQYAFLLSDELFSDIKSYIDDHYVEQVEKLDQRKRSHEKRKKNFSLPRFRSRNEKHKSEEILFELHASPVKNEEFNLLSEALNHMDESFSEMLLRKIDESGMSDAQCYKKANIDRRLFSKIRSNRNYKPSKSTVLSFAIALELPLDLTRELLEKAGYALSHSDKADIIIEFFIKNGNYNIFEINQALFTFDQRTLGV